MQPYYDDGQIQIWHADCRDVLPSIEPGSVDLVLTDPPYGISLNTQNKTRNRGNSKEKHWPSRDFAQIEGDNRPFDPSPLLVFKRSVLWGANHYATRLPESPSWLVWDKLNGLQSKRDFGFNDNADAELAWTNLGGPVRLIPHRWMGLLRESETSDKRVHPTQKPVALMRWIVERFTKPGDLVFDPYMGSGPIAKACHETGRRYIGIEIVESYCIEAVKRLQQSVLPLAVA